jgi:hypothetical protein
MLHMSEKINSAYESGLDLSTVLHICQSFHSFRIDLPQQQPTPSLRNSQFKLSVGHSFHQGTLRKSEWRVRY